MGTALLIALAVAATLGDVCLALTWGRICARFKIKRALVAVSLASMLSAGICFLYAVLPLPGVTVLFVGTFAETTLLAATLFGALFLGLSLAGKRLPSLLLGAGGGMLCLCCALAFA